MDLILILLARHYFWTDPHIATVCTFGLNLMIYLRECSVQYLTRTMAVSHMTHIQNTELVYSANNIPRGRKISPSQSQQRNIIWQSQVIHSSHRQVSISSHRQVSYSSYWQVSNSSHRRVSNSSHRQVSNSSHRQVSNFSHRKVSNISHKYQ
jgi:hypothetical protein